ncbi:MAG: hypothetical protein JNL30_15625 [Rubrivivax sp.]|nr:hypothetical protein [Rubrivivax sp.]
MPASPPATERGLPPRVVLALLALGLAALLGWQVWQGRPVTLPEAGAGSKLPCVSYAPFRRPGHTPFDATLRIGPELIEADLRLLAKVSGCVRTYGIDHGLDMVPAVARKLGLTVMLGAWIGRDAAANEAQLERALALARDNADVVRLLVVGNEVLLRRELPPHELAALLQRARRHSPVPVAYADVWEFWLRHASVLRGHVDVVAAHVLPYWEDEPVGIGHAVDHVHAVTAQVRQALAPLPVWVAETGWPAQGRQRGPALPGAREQARFVRELLARPLPAQAGAPGFNVIEAFDQPWKRALEGAMGGGWGLFDAAGHPRVLLSGPQVRSDAGFERVAAGAALGVLVGAVVGWVAGRATGRSLGRPGADEAGRAKAAPGLVGLLAFTFAMAWIGALVMLQWPLWRAWSHDLAQASAGGLFAATAISGGLFAALQLTERVAAVSRAGPMLALPLHPPGLADAWRQRAPWHRRAAAAVRLATLFATACIALGLLFDPRYRPLAWPVLAAPAAMWGALALLGERLSPGAREERVLGALIGLAAPALMAQEGMANTQAWGLAATWVAMAAATCWPHRAACADAGRAHTSAASSTAGAASPLE